MCCTFTESVMSNTKLFVGEAQKDGKHVHVLAYQNNAGSRGPNAMVIPFPTNVPMTQENVIDTSKFKNFLTDITNASKMVTKSASRRGMTLGAASFSFNDAAEVFDVGSYTVVLATKASQIPEALTRVPADRRPTVSNQFLLGYSKLYPNQPIAVCCWDGEIEAEPLLWWYEPSDTTQLFIPTMDAHDGGAPVVGQSVYTDHIISVGSVGPTTGHQVHYKDKLPDEVKELLPTHVFGKRLPSRLVNSDCFVKTAPLHAEPKGTMLYGSPAVELKRAHGEQTFYNTVMNGWS